VNSAGSAEGPERRGTRMRAPCLEVRARPVEPTLACAKARDGFGYRVVSEHLRNYPSPVSCDPAIRAIDELARSRREIRDSVRPSLVDASNTSLFITANRPGLNRNDAKSARAPRKKAWWDSQTGCMSRSFALCRHSPVTRWGEDFEGSPGRRPFAHNRRLDTRHERSVRTCA
jgi:hypothetical protein